MLSAAIGITSYFCADGIVNEFKVDGIPHVAFLNREAEVKTALVGAVPKSLLEADLNALIKVSAITH